jgi:hypothetical protein
LEETMKIHQKSGPVLICLALIVVATLVIAGCRESTPSQQGLVTTTNDKQTENHAAGTGVMTGAMPVPMPDLSPAFITIDPIGDKKTGDLVIFSGTTDLPSGTSVYLKEINESTGESTTRANNFVCPDSRGVNRWRFVYDSTSWMKPGIYRYRVSTPKGDVNTSVQFNLTGTFLGPEKILYYQSGSRSATISGSGSYPYITVDPIGDRHTGDIFRISGTTNLIEGTLLYGTVWPVYFEDRSKRPSTISQDFCDGQFNMIGYSMAVVKGTGDTNRWSFPADMTIQVKTEMKVHVSTRNEDLTKREIFGNATFNLK